MSNSDLDEDGDYSPLFGDDDSDADSHFEPGTKQIRILRRRPTTRHTPGIEHDSFLNEGEQEYDQIAGTSREDSAIAVNGATAAGEDRPPTTDDEPTRPTEQEGPTYGEGPPDEEDQSSEDEPRPKRAKNPGRKKTRRVESWKRNISQKKRNEGKAYIDRKGLSHPEKKVTEYNHPCRFKCNENFDEAKRNQIFKEYWELGDWELQTAFLQSSIKLDKPERKKSEGSGSKSVSCQFYLLERRVCKKFFLYTLDVSNKRITNVISKKAISSTGISPKDKRGHKVPGNKLSEDKVAFVKEHIRRFPRYTSHYSRSQAPNKKYLSPGLNIKKMYNLYRESCVEHMVEPVKESYYRHIFNTEFNLSFHRPHTDTCVTCDKLQNTINNGTPDEKQSAITQKEVHLRKAESARQQIKDAQETAKDDTSHLVICFDLQKMLPSPVLTCSRVYYARQLWTYNFCIHNLVSNNASMFMWHEAQAARGCEEMLSCLLRLVKTLPTRVKKITMFSDNAGGQNKSRFTVKFWLYIVRTTHIEEVDHKYLLSGHSYNDCDKNFGVIERAHRNSGTGIFTPEHWMNIVAKSSSRFMVVNMEDQDFISLKSLEEHYVKSVTGIRSMQWLRFQKSDPYTLFYKNTFNADMPFSQYNMKPKEAPKQRLPQQLSAKNAAPGIKASKYKDLQSLLQFIPPSYHVFYNNLKIQRERQQPGRGGTVPTDAEEDRTEVEDEEPDAVWESDSE